MNLRYMTRAQEHMSEYCESEVSDASTDSDDSFKKMIATDDPFAEQDVSQLEEKQLQRTMYTPTTITNYISLNTPGYVSIKGEISGIFLHSNGHVFFDVKDAKNGLRCFAWRVSCDSESLDLLRNLNTVKKGKYETQKTEVIVEGLIKLDTFRNIGLAFTVYHVSCVEMMEKSQIEQWRKELSDGGYFDKIENTIPNVLRKVAVFTSKDGAVIKDVLSVFESFRFGNKIELFPCSVQGTGCVRSLLKLLEEWKKSEVLREKYDVICIIRGGGSSEDLFEYNRPELCRAVYNFRKKYSIPIVCAIGHTEDHVLLEHVVDKSHITPTGLAQHLVEPMRMIQHKLYHALVGACHKVLLNGFRVWKEKLEAKVWFKKFMLRRQKQFHCVEYARGMKGIIRVGNWNVKRAHKIRTLRTLLRKKELRDAHVFFRIIHGMYVESKMRAKLLREQQKKQKEQKTHQDISETVTIMSLDNEKISGKRFKNEICLGKDYVLCFESIRNIQDNESRVVKKYRVKFESIEDME